MAHEMTNAAVAATLHLLADLLAIRDESPYKVLAYRRAAESIAGLAEPLEAIRQRGALEAIPGVGAEIARKIGSLLDTGTFPLLQEVEAEIPPGVAALLAVPGIGPKRARALYQRLGSDSLDALRAALAQGRLGAAGVGPREAERLAAALRSLQATDARLPLAVARALGLEIIRALRDRVPAIRRIDLAGSIRRMRETIGDLDIVAAVADPASAVAAGADLERLLWVQASGRIDHAMKAADLILHGGGFGVVALDLCEIAPNQLLRIPLSYWYRFRLAVEKTPTTFVVAGARPIAKSCAGLQLEAKRKRVLWSGQAPFRLLAGAEFEVASRKPGRIEPAVLRAAV